jgi:hypothetical protein
MSAKKSELLSAFGTFWEILKAITNAVLDRGGSDEDLRRILSDKKLLADLADRIMMSSVMSFLVDTYKQEVNYDLSVYESLSLGKYDRKNDNITNANFFSKETDVCEIEFGIFHFDRTTSSKSNIANMNKVGFRPATTKEILSFGEKHPELQLKHPIVALGLVAEFDGNRWVVWLGRQFSERCVNLGYFDSEWTRDYCFLGVRI